MFKDYLLKSEKTFKFNIKSTDELSDDMMDKLEKALFKYRPVSVSSPNKTMFHKYPLSIMGKTCGELWMVDIVLSVPVSATLLQVDLRTMLGYGKQDETIRVFSEGDPQNADDKEAECPDEEDEKLEERGSLLAKGNYEEVEDAKFSDFYGDDYNDNFKAFLKEYEKKRKEEAKAGAIDATNPLVLNADIPELGSDLDPNIGTIFLNPDKK